MVSNAMDKAFQGEVWFDDKPERSLAQKLERAAARFSDKHQYPATTVIMGRDMVDGSDVSHLALDIWMRETSPYGPGYFWIGVPAREIKGAELWHAKAS